MKVSGAFVGAMVVLGFLAVIAALVVFEIPPSNKDALMQMFGTLSSMAGLVVGYHYGTSAGSQRKTELLSQTPPPGAQGGG